MGQEDPLEEGMATHSSILAWRILQTEDPGGPEVTKQQQRDGGPKSGLKHMDSGTSLEVRQLGLCVPNLGAVGSIPGQGTKIPHAAWHSQKKKKKIMDSNVFV